MALERSLTHIESSSSLERKSQQLKNKTSAKEPNGCVEAFSSTSNDETVKVRGFLKEKLKSTRIESLQDKHGSPHFSDREIIGAMTDYVHVVPRHFSS